MASLQAARKPAARPKAARSATPAPAAAQASAVVVPFPGAAVQALQPGVMLQRKGCACGGSCPRCADDEVRRKVQPKLRVGAVDDPYEREADRIAQQALGVSSAPGLVPDRSPLPQTQAVTTTSRPDAHAAHQSHPPADPTEAQLTSGGSPLAPGLRQFFESRLGRDLSAVRVHAGREAEGPTDHFDAHAFTLGHHVWLGRGQQPAPNFLLAHELAHVVQQRQPQTVQRIGRALFWIPLNTAGMMTGTDIHGELIDEAVGKNKQLDDEAPAPNADAAGWGLGHQGRIDIYRGKKGTKFHVMPGVTWTPVQNIPVGSQSDDPMAATPRAHFQAKVKASKGTIAPTMDGPRVVDIPKGPAEVAVGELKPASADILGKGEGQLTNYREGMAHSARLANAWARLTTATGKTAPEWKLAPPTNLAEADVQFKDEHKFDPNNLKGDQNLVLGRVSEGSGTFGQKYKVSVEYDPKTKKLPPIKGGLYAMPAGKPGLWMYFSRPQNLDAALALARGNVNVQGNMVLANRIQDEVIVPLLKAPEKVTKFSRLRGAPPGSPAPGAPRPAAPAVTADTPRLRRKQRTSPKLEDRFELKKWQKSQTDLRGEANPKTDPAKTNLESLEFLHKAYEAEDALDQIPGGKAGKSKLPPKTKDMVKAGTDPKTARSHPLADIIRWARGWTGRAAGALGILRDKFGDTFVFAANKFIEIRDAVRKKVREFLDKKHKKLGTGLAAAVTRAIGRGLKIVLQTTLHQTAHYIVNKVEAGIVRKLKTWFDFDPEKLLDDALEATFGNLLKPVEDLRKKVQTFFDDTVKSVTGSFGWVEDLQSLASKVGPIIEAAVIALQCLTPPGWGCLKMLARRLQNWAIDQVLQMCDVKLLVAKLVAQVPFLSNLPKFLGDKALNMMKEVAPKEFKDVFETDTPVPPADKMECDDDWDPEETPPAPGPQRDLQGNLDTLQELNEMRTELGEDKMEGLSDLVGASGLPDETPLTLDQVKALRQRMRDLNPTAQEMKDVAQGKAAEDVKKKLQPLMDHLNDIAGKARKRLLEQMQQDLRAGKFDDAFKQLAVTKRTWVFLRTPPLGSPFTGARVLMADGTVKAGGLIDGVMGVCDKQGEVEVTIVRADLRNADKPDEVVTIAVPVKGPLGGMCGTPGSPPVAGGQASEPQPGGGGKVAEASQGGDKAGAGAASGPGGTSAPGGGGGGGSEAGGGGGGDQGEKGDKTDKGGSSKPGKTGPTAKPTVGDVIAAGPGGGGGSQGGTFDGFFDFCDQVLKCPASATMVTFEAEDDPSLGLRVVRRNLSPQPGSAGSLQRARNKLGVVTTKDLGDGTFEVYLLDVDDKPHLVGKAVKSADFAGEFEVRSGAILKQFKAAAKKWEKRFNIPASQSRAHKFRF